MAIFKWNQNLSVGIPEMDLQHKKLVDLINLLYDGMRHGKGIEVLKDVIDELVNYTQYHFTAEENLMQEYGYPQDQFSLHRQYHINFTNKVVDIKEKFESGQIVTAVNVGEFLREWLVKHIQKVDGKYGQFINCHTAS